MRRFYSIVSWCPKSSPTNVFSMACPQRPLGSCNWSRTQHTSSYVWSTVCPCNSSIQKLHWLSVGFQVHSKVLVIIHKLLYDTRPVCLWDHLWLYCLVPHTVPSWSWYFMDINLMLLDMGNLPSLWQCLPFRMKGSQISLSYPPPHTLTFQKYLKTSFSSRHFGWDVNCGYPRDVCLFLNLLVLFLILC